MTGARIILVVLPLALIPSMVWVFRACVTRFGLRLGYFAAFCAYCLFWFIAVSGLVGCLWGWVARTSGRILWITAAHVLFDLSGLSARIYMRPMDRALTEREPVRPV